MRIHFGCGPDGSGSPQRGKHDRMRTTSEQQEIPAQKLQFYMSLSAILQGSYTSFCLQRIGIRIKIQV